MTGSKVIDIHKVLAKSIKEKFDIVFQETKSLTTPGEHYGSIMLAVDVKIKFAKDGREQFLSLVAKLQPANEMLREAFDVPSTFKKEVFAYTVMIPTLAEFQKEWNIPQEKSIASLFPKCYGARLSLDETNDQVDEGAVLVLENLKLQGYYTDDRLVGFGFDAAQVILRDLARFHATAIALKRLNPKVFEEKVKACTRIGNACIAYPAEFEAALKNSVIEGAKGIPALQPYLANIEKVLRNFGTERPVPEETWATICHADFWLSNTMLLNSDSDKPISTKIVDLQLAVYSSALTDLLFFLFTSIKNSILDESFDAFLRIYYDCFCDNLRDYGIDTSPYSWESFEKELEFAGPIEACHILVMLKPICSERNAIKNSFEKFENSDWNRMDLLGPHHQKKLKDTVLKLVQKKWL